MKKEPFGQHLEEATEQLRLGGGADDLRDFERGVWVAIALHDERWTTRMARIFREGIPALPGPAVAGSVAIALIAGVLTALVQVKAYGESVSDSMEAQYASSIHPVLRSQSDGYRHDSLNH
jgi:hypothetical protein